MSTPKEVNEILELLRDKQFDKLIGKVESLHLECKGQPYDLTRDSQKAELSKDVSAFANADGGILLLGFKTETKHTLAEDEIVEYRPIPNEKIDVGQLQSILNSWLYPSASCAKIEIFLADKNHITVAIVVSKASQQEWPILVRKPSLDDGTKSENLVGYFERSLGRVVARPIERIHSLIREGIASTTVDARLESIQNAIVAIQSELKQNQSGNVTTQKPNVRGKQSVPIDTTTVLNQALERTGLGSEPTFALICRPHAPIAIEHLFESRVAKIVQAIDHPPEIRSGGFDLDLGGNSKIVTGEKRVTAIQNYGVCEVYENGLVLYAFRADREGLSWGRQQRQQDFLLINQLTLVEKVFLFVSFVKQIYEDVANIGNLDFEVHFLRFAEEGKVLHLESGPLNSFSQKVEPAPSGSHVLRVTVEASELSYPERAAAKILKKIYNWFGMTNSAIPYLEHDSNADAVNVSAISNQK